MNRIVAVQECDARMPGRITEAGNKKIKNKIEKITNSDEYINTKFYSLNQKFAK